MLGVFLLSRCITHPPRELLRKIDKVYKRKNLEMAWVEGEGEPGS